MSDSDGCEGGSPAEPDDTPSIRREVSVRLARLVDQAYPNQDVAARIAGTSKSTLQRHVAGATRLDFEIVARLTRCAGQSLDWLAWGQGHDGQVRAGEATEQEGGAQEDRDRVQDAALFVLATVRHFGKEHSPEELAEAIATRYVNFKKDAAPLGSNSH